MEGSSFEMENNGSPGTAPISKIIAVASIAAGIQFGWALQLSLLTPYVQVLGIPHSWASYIWLCGPIAGLTVQPVVGYFSDRSTCRFGRRKPFIAAGTFFVAISVFMIGYAVDIGHAAGDSLGKGTKVKAIIVYVTGFWILDVSNNMMQGPCRAFLADLSNGSPRMTSMGNAFFSFFMAVGNVLGYAAGSYGGLHKMFPFTSTPACNVYCANLKSCFFISIFLLVLVTVVALLFVEDKPAQKKETEADEMNKQPFISQLYVALKGLSKPMWCLILVTALNWIGWFAFILYNTDWVGREIYGGDAAGTDSQVALYDNGVRTGALGLMLNSVVLGFMSLGIDMVGRMLGGVKNLWGIANFILAICLGLTVLVSKAAAANRHTVTLSNGETQLLHPAGDVRAGTLAIFAVLGIPQAVTFSIPFALASIFCHDAGAGQGLSLGILNLAIVIPQMIVSVGSGPLDAAFGGGNLPAFVAGAIAAALSGLCAIFVLPKPPSDAVAVTSVAGFH